MPRNNINGDIAAMNDLKIAPEGANSVICVSFAKQSKENNDSELEPIFSTGKNISVNISGNFML